MKFNSTLSVMLITAAVLLLQSLFKDALSGTSLFVLLCCLFGFYSLLISDAKKRMQFLAISVFFCSFVWFPSARVVSDKYLNKIFNSEHKFEFVVTRVGAQLGFKTLEIKERRKGFALPVLYLKDLPWIEAPREGDVLLCNGTASHLVEYSLLYKDKQENQILRCSKQYRNEENSPTDAVLDLKRFNRSASIIKAVVLGQRDEIPEWIKEHAREYGWYHTVVLSGLHVIIVTWVIAYVFRTLVACSGFHKTFYTFYCSKLLELGCVSAYFSCLYMSIPVLRAIFAYYFSLLLIHRCVDEKVRLAIPVLLTMSVYPLALLAPSLQFVCAALCGIYAVGYLQKEYFQLSKGFIYETSRVFFTGVLVSIFTVPIQLYWFGSMSVKSIFLSGCITMLAPALLILPSIISYSLCRIEAPLGCDLLEYYCSFLELVFSYLAE